MEDNIYGYIYCITCEVNLKVYIGQHKYDKSELDPNYFCSSMNPEFWDDVEKYGINNFRKELLFLAHNMYELNELEEITIEEYRRKYGIDQVYNISSGAGTGLKGLKLTDPDRYNKLIKIFNDSGHTKSANEKRLATLRDKYNGDAMGMCHTPEAIIKRVQSDKDSHGGIMAIHSEDNERKAYESKVANGTLMNGVNACHTKEVRYKIDATKRLNGTYERQIEFLSSPEIRSKATSTRNSNKHVFLEISTGYTIVSSSLRSYNKKPDKYKDLGLFSEYDGELKPRPHYSRTDNLDWLRPNGSIWVGHTNSARKRMHTLNEVWICLGLHKITPDQSDN